MCYTRKPPCRNTLQWLLGMEEKKKNMSDIQRLHHILPKFNLSTQPEPRFWKPPGYQAIFNLHSSTIRWGFHSNRLYLQKHRISFRPMHAAHIKHRLSNSSHHAFHPLLCNALNPLPYPLRASAIQIFLGYKQAPPNTRLHNNPNHTSALHHLPPMIQRYRRNQERKNQNAHDRYDGDCCGCFGNVPHE